ncbi:MAG: ABC transporter substrate-binding protein [Candidatus Marinimicrobia bacterium]|nr:ABC transporter substrate-binding protein [Candidatus Neomarinimicrobiota bacterium]
MNKHICNAAIILLLTASASFAADKVKLRLNWMYYGSHAGFALGFVDGTYAKHGIDLDIRSGNGSSSAHRLVANKDSDFSYGSCGAMTNLVAKGAPIKSIGVIDAMGTEAILVRPDSGVKTIKDLKGKKILTTANAGVNTFFPIVLKNAGLSESDVNITSVPDGALVSSYLQGSGGAVAILGGLDDKPAEIKANGGAQPIAFPYSDYGVNQVGYCIATHNDTIKNNPGLAKRFIKATMEAYAKAEKDPDAAVNAIADIVGGSMAEDAGKAQSREVLNVTLGILYSEANKNKVLGLNVPADWDSMVKLMKEYNDLDKSAKSSDFYTNQFIN